MLLQGFNITNNTADEDCTHGFILVYSAQTQPVICKDMHFEGNESRKSGGIFVYATDSTFENISFLNNVSADEVASLWLNIQDIASLTKKTYITGCTFEGNKALAGAGIIIETQV